ncbi:GAF domain-containing sensor histidine kinase [Beijerinckia sp. L45]|uniref:GAF domain-containing sensor histidine kinase n=1 Tax=Beijerinckia sp. L45 TaxID=1641855 RepID=UPI00131CAF3B|nr:GAF domain-containing sensor histidine kinase [Beijerinckia sp. L45]
MERVTVDTLQDDVAAIANIDAVPTILEVICRTTGMGFAAVARVTEDRWIACSVRDDIEFGLKAGGELKVETTICDSIRNRREAVVIDHVAEDAIYRDHHTPALYRFQSYISMPILMPDGQFFGTLCAIDPRPARINTPHVVGMFKLFAELIAFHIDAHRKLAASAAVLLDERHASVLREQFIAVLGHDLRNPLAAIDGGAHLLLRRAKLDEASTSVVTQIRKSVDRMAELIDNVLDFARGRLGSGLNLQREDHALLLPTLQHVVSELRAASPGRTIETDFALAGSINCDGGRIGQLLSNLVGNAIAHGAANRPIKVEASTDDGVLRLAVINGGVPIPPDTIEHLFAPFFRAPRRATNQGLGLGLYIASEIAKAHGGTLAVTSTEAETRFSFRMPLTES